MPKPEYGMVEIGPRIWAYRAYLRQMATVRYKWLRARDLNLQAHRQSSQQTDATLLPEIDQVDQHPVLVQPITGHDSMAALAAEALAQAPPRPARRPRLSLTAPALLRAERCTGAQRCTGKTPGD